MIKKVVLLLLIVIGLYGSWTTFKLGYFGIQTEKFTLKRDVPSYETLKNSQSELKAKNTELNGLIIQKASAEKNVDTEIQNYENKRKRYEDLTRSATREEIAEANKVEKYLLDYLWIRIGNYANDNDVKFKLTPRTEVACLDFDITGSYISIINFIYDIQNDPQLNFKINGIDVQGGSSDKVVKAKFTVENINVVTSPDEEVQIKETIQYGEIVSEEEVPESETLESEILTEGAGEMQ